VKYEGEWQRGQKHGSGISTYPDGSRFEGTYERDQRAQGLSVKADGRVYEQQWQDGQLMSNVLVKDPGADSRYIYPLLTTVG